MSIIIIIQRLSLFPVLVVAVKVSRPYVIRLEFPLSMLVFLDFVFVQFVTILLSHLVQMHYTMKHHPVKELEKLALINNYYRNITRNRYM